MFKKILVPTDGSKLSKQAVKAAVELAAEVGAKVVALNVQPPFQPPVVAEVPIAYVYTPKEYEAAAGKAAQKVLAEAQKAAEAAGVSLEAVYEFDPSPYEAIIRIAKNRKCDLILMSSHGRRGLSGLLLGSETTKVLTHCKIPVLVHR